MSCVSTKQGRERWQAYLCLHGHYDRTPMVQIKFTMTGVATMVQMTGEMKQQNAVGVNESCLSCLKAHTPGVKDTLFLDSERGTKEAQKRLLGVERIKLSPQRWKLENTKTQQSTQIQAA